MPPSPVQTVSAGIAPACCASNSAGEAAFRSNPPEASSVEFRKSLRVISRSRPRERSEGEFWLALECPDDFFNCTPEEELGDTSGIIRGGVLCRATCTRCANIYCFLFPSGTAYWEETASEGSS